VSGVRVGQSVPEVVTDSGIPVDVAYGAEPPGEFPYTRGIHPTMYRGRLWTMRIYAGWGAAEETNERFRYLLDRGQTGLSVALDLPTQMGLDPDHPLADGEVGKVGVSVATLADMEAIFDGIPLDRVSTSFTINATAPILLAMYVAVARGQGVRPDEVRGTVQNDILKEYLARKTYVFPPGPSMRLVTDVLEWSARELPRFHPISVCGYHMRQAGCDAIQEVAFALGNGLAYLDAVVRRGVPVDEVAPRFSFNISTMRDLFEEVAKHRAARRLWARMVQERFSPQDERSLQLRLFSGGDGTSLTAREPLNNVVRVAYQALAIVLSGAQAVHTISWDEALGLPAEDAVLLALRTQQILAHEVGVARTVDPLGGSYYVEHLTDEIERRAEALMAEVEERGGMVQGILDGSLERLIAEGAYRQQLEVESGERTIVGVNRFVDDDPSREGDVRPLHVSAAIGERQRARLADVRARRDADRVEAALRRLEGEARGEANLMPAILECVEAHASVGEICDRLARVFGRHEASTVV
jgi:methylmalonyl-CoA mutase, N-terminal domain